MDNVTYIYKKMPEDTKSVGPILTLINRVLRESIESQDLFSGLERLTGAEMAIRDQFDQDMTLVFHSFRMLLLGYIREAEGRKKEDELK